MRYDAMTLRRAGPQGAQGRLQDCVRNSEKELHGNNEDGDNEDGDNKTVRAKVLAGRNKIQDRPTQRMHSS
ncbi:hypothetical protein PG987_010703 [Apiospora arundinis]